MIVVVDVSVVAKWYLPEEFSEQAELLAAGNFDLRAPELLLVEFANILWKKHRSAELTLEKLREIVSAGIDRNIHFHPHQALVEPSVLRSVETDQPVYDWFYLTLAMELGAPFITADRKFFRAMRSTRYKNDVIWIGNLEKLIKARPQEDD